MSTTADNLERALAVELARPEVLTEIATLELDVIKAVQLLERVGLKALEGVLRQAIPSPLRPLFSALVEPWLDRGITALENLTDEEARKLLPIHAAATIGTKTFAISVARVWPADLPQGPCETVADWPGCKE